MGTEGFLLCSIRTVATTMHIATTAMIIIHVNDPSPPPVLAETCGKRSWLFEFMMYGVSPIPSLPVTFWYRPLYRSVPS